MGCLCVPQKISQTQREAAGDDWPQQRAKDVTTLKSLYDFLFKAGYFILHEQPCQQSLSV